MKKHRHFTQPIQKEAKKSKASTYLTIFVGLIMVFSIGEIFFSNPDVANNHQYGKYSFKPANGQWQIKLNGNTLNFYNLPEQVIQYKPSAEALTLIKNAQGVIISVDPKTNIPAQLQALDLFRFNIVDSLMKAYKGKQIGFGAVINTSAYSLPIITCENASLAVPVVVVGYSNETTVQTKNDCILVSAQDESSLINVMEALRYAMFGVYDEAN